MSFWEKANQRLPYKYCALRPQPFFDFVMISYDDIIMRTIVDLPAEQVRKLALLCRKEKISRAEAVRRAVEQLLRNTSASGLQAYFGASKTRANISRHVTRLRREWAERG